MTNKEKYNELVKNETTFSVYDQPWWLDAVCGADNWDVYLYEKKGNIIGAMPVYIKKRLGIKYFSQPPFTQHNGVWIKYTENQVESKRLSLEKEVINGLLDQIESSDCVFYQQAQSPNLTNWLPFYWRGYKQTTHYTYRINDIEDTEKLFQNFQPNKKKHIRKAIKAEMVVKFDLQPEIFYEFHKKSLEKQGKTIFYDLTMFKKMHDAAYANNSGRTIYLESKDGKLLCALFNLWDSNYGYDLISAIDPNIRSSGAPDFLVYSMIKYLSDKVHGYDFEGSMIEGVEESFRHFGAIQTPYFFISKIYTKNPLLQMLISHKFNG